MKTVTIAGLDKRLSKIIMGTMIIGLDNYAQSAALLDDALELGVNAFDIAYVYGGGNSERAVGKWMEERGNREKVFVITKGAHHNMDRKRVTPYDITSDLMDSLARLRTDYIDAYLLHRDDLDVPVGPIVEILNEHRGAGRIRAFGGSNWTHGRIAEANEYAAARGLAPMTVSSPNYGLCEQVDDPWGPGCVTVSGDIGAEARKFYLRENMPIMAYSSLGRGMLSGRVTRDNYKELLDGAALKAYAYEVNFQRLDRARELAAEKGVSVPQIALAYILNQPLNVFPIVGAASRKELEETAASAEIALTARELSWLETGA
jgi:aryl-alcohol dehydrogenase-like predicted oxidoreductase